MSVMDQLKLEKYLERIHFSEAPEMNMETLKRIHQLHPQYIPFENIDPYTGNIPSLNLDDVFSKLVTESRGGYCFEQNLLLREVLKYIGFDTRLQQARVVWKREEDAIAAKTHLLLIVNMHGQEYLVDCGFGIVTLTAPLLLHNEEPQQTPNGQFKISKKEELYILWFWKEKWLPVYRFALEYVEPLDLDIANWYLSTYPESMFKKNLVLSKVDEEARYTFSDHTLNIRKETNEKESVAIESDKQLFQILKDIFGLKENAVKLLKEKITKE
ncbi:arylamine N-acetyltransferase [Chryseobacterium rhizosphaerae]|uniref:Arylamine N-acetyltransferase n=2 Tax=Chryseobacterium rhizosphaerae TaxID=395937 RepID=A0ABX9INV3_9FLAO|nr:arylamine N-acetyltransferase [Chryseobacterium rhizosphaerae]GEN65769.1 N-hydroxyarylamine O-acetyltransferase [Chryseobacterium rhizosphaerae]